MPSNQLILCHPLLLLPSIFPSIGVFSNESVLCIRWPKYWSFSFSISPSSDTYVCVCVCVCVCKLQRNSFCCFMVCFSWQIILFLIAVCPQFSVGTNQNLLPGLHSSTSSSQSFSTTVSSHFRFFWVVQSYLRIRQKDAIWKLCGQVGKACRPRVFPSICLLTVSLLHIKKKPASQLLNYCREEKDVVNIY